ncbi:PH domain-containing protein [Mangrovicoccus ximenensis]|uniref:hypothetical protein n=1 Tax=Mangrovicoccus ximenensis TaxID=1911570 RepID=UPI000D34FED5|nr:hypothetical protein [Mangrovicoccus ximenensis]
MAEIEEICRPPSVASPKSSCRIRLSAPSPVIVPGAAVPRPEMSTIGAAGWTTMTGDAVRPERSAVSSNRPVQELAGRKDRIAPGRASWGSWPVKPGEVKAACRPAPTWNMSTRLAPGWKPIAKPPSGVPETSPSRSPAA